MNWLPQIFGIGAMVCLFLIYQQKTRRNILFCKLGADICWVVHYLMLGGIAGAIPNGVGIFRELIFLHRKSKKWTASLLWPIFFILVGWGLGLRTFHSFYNVLPIAASTFVTVSLWIDDPRLTKMISLPVCAAFFLYDLSIGSYIGMINESISIISIAVSLAKERKYSMRKTIFSKDVETTKELVFTPGAPIEKVARTIRAVKEGPLYEKGAAFAQEIRDRFVSDFEKPGDKMAHVSTFLVVGNTLVTPRLTDSVLESITRDTILRLAERAGIPVVERTVDRTELYPCDEAFLCGSAMEITPILSVDKYPIGDGCTGEVTARLHKAYLDAATGKNKEWQGWITPIY